MSGRVFETVVVPIASRTDADATCRALEPYVESSSRVIVVHVIEKAGGAPDKASVEQRELRAEDVFEAVEAWFADAGPAVESELLYGTDVADAIVAHAADVNASAIVFTPRGAGRWMKLLSGRITEALIDRTDRPVVVLPPRES